MIAGAVAFTACSTASQSEESSEEEVASETTEETEETEEEEPPASPRMEVESEMNGTTVKVDWGSPGVKERVIWGDLVPYGEVWRAGANETTNIEFSSDVTLGGTAIPAGKYGLLIIPQEEGDWTVIINKNWSREEHGVWGSNGYDEEKDVARITVAPTWSEESSERLKYDITEEGVEFAWEKARLTVSLAISE